MATREWSRSVLRTVARRSEERADAHDDGGREPLPLPRKAGGEVDRGRLGAAGLLRLQGAVGNRHVAQLLARGEAKGAARAPTSSGAPLATEVRARMESAFGADLSAVRVHQGPQAESIGALAYTRGTDIHFAPGAYQPHSQEGQRVLGHELAHVVQQSEGRVRATTAEDGVAINADRSLEREADDMGARAARGGRAASGGARGAAPLRAESSVAQRMALGQGAAALAQIQRRKPLRDVHVEELEAWLVVKGFGSEPAPENSEWEERTVERQGKEMTLKKRVGNPFEKVVDAKQLLELFDQYLREKHKDELKPSSEIIEPPSPDFLDESKSALIAAEEKHEQYMEENPNTPFHERLPQWVPVNGGPKNEETPLYRFCTFNELSRILPRLAWESYDATLQSVKESKRTKLQIQKNQYPNPLESWSVPQYQELKQQGLECIKESKNEDFDPSKSDLVMKRAQKHMGDVQTRLSPFVSLSEDYALLVQSECPTMQSIVRSDKNLKDVEPDLNAPNQEEQASHKFHLGGGGIKRASDYKRAPHLVKFEVPTKFIITPEMVDKYNGFTEQDLQEGLGLKGMREAKERLFLGADLWKYAVAVAINPF